MKKKKEYYGSYYEGPMEDSGLPFEERVRLEQEAKERDKELTGWDDPAIEEDLKATLQYAKKRKRRGSKKRDY